ncbi:hypothetical protein [Salicibibacter kimchii]|uniref:Uncharacterized protein n=1 Tax=Salicibibacter kimchii TaxID=2099786 RepID=A0A345BWB8_9BACI|nr:hypothetical protein [Salicibibacter kimchii]AXF55249.1 hypothetical protein DT065_03925 [Salicibibacter kimchii]
MHPAGEDGETYSQSDAYGFYFETREVTIEEEETSEANFILEEMPSGEIEGTVVNERDVNRLKMLRSG